MLRYKLWRFIGIAILAYMLFALDWEQMRDVLHQANPLPITIALFTNLPQLWLKSTRWQTLLSMQGYKVKNWDAFLYYLSSVYLGIITPGRIGEFAKVAYLKQEKITTLSRGFASVLVDRIFDLYLLIVLAALGLVVIPFRPGNDGIGWGILIGAVAGPMLVLFTGRTERLLSLLYHKIVAPKISDYFKEGIEQFVQGLRAFFKWRIWQVGFLTIMSSALFFLQCLLVAHAVNINISYFEIVPIMAITNLFTFLPISIAGLGTRETALLFLLAPKGIGIELILAYSMGILLVFFIGGGVIGAVAWWLRPLEVTELRKVSSK